MTGEYVRQLAEFFNDGYVFDARVSISPNVLRFKKGTSELYAIWECEKMTVGKRPKFSEQIGTYILNVKGKILRLVDDGSDMIRENFYGGKILYGSKPVFVVTKKN